MEKFDAAFVDFLIEAKRSTYAAGGPPTGSSRRASKDLSYRSGEYEYLDSYLGAADFIGEEIVYRDDIPIWGMNYYGRSIGDVDAGNAPDSVGMGEVLHAALMEPSREAPYRGPRSHKSGNCEYRCSWEGEPENFFGSEEILRKGKRIYFLRFNGGSLR
jgi:Domain of unknown function (DUF5680)